MGSSLRRRARLWPGSGWRSRSGRSPGQSSTWRGGRWRRHSGSASAEARLRRARWRSPTPMRPATGLSSGSPRARTTRPRGRRSPMTKPLATGSGSPLVPRTLRPQRPGSPTGRAPPRAPRSTSRSILPGSRSASRSMRGGPRRRGSASSRAGPVRGCWSARRRQPWRSTGRSREPWRRRGAPALARSCLSRSRSAASVSGSPPFFTSLWSVTPRRRPVVVDRPPAPTSGDVLVAGHDMRVSKARGPGCCSA